MAIRTARGPHIPLEVLYEIVDHLEGDSSALRNCALACRPLLSHARSLLFRDVQLNCRSGKSHPDPLRDSIGNHITAFANLLRHNPSIGVHVKRLKLYRHFRLGIGGERWPLTRELVCFCKHLTEVRSLILENVRIHTTDDFFTLVNFPKLETLYCDLISIEVPGPCPSGDIFQPPLKRLTIHQSIINSAENWPQQCEATVPLQRLKITGLKLATRWYAFISSGAATLQHIDVTTDEATIMPEGDDSYPSAYLSRPFCNEHSALINSVVNALPVPSPNAHRDDSRAPV